MAGAPAHTTLKQREATWCRGGGAYRVGVHVHVEGGGVVLRLGQLVQERHHVEPRVFQQTVAHGCRGERRGASGHPS